MFTISSDCPDGYYGDSCNTTCPGNCKSNVTCDHISGACHDGICKTGYKGEKCNKGNWKKYLNLSCWS